MKPFFVLIFALTLFFTSCNTTTQQTLDPAVKDGSLISYVNPFIGTGGHGHTYPGATMPFGMMQLSPDTRLDGWDGCSGYHYSDSYIYGFSHTHLSGTGISDYADVLLMPVSEIIFNNGADGKKGYKAHFSHDNETASPGYYSVQLDSINVKAEMTVSYRSGKHRYSFPEGQKQLIILDLEHRDMVLDAKLNLLSETEISGHRHSKAWADDQRLFFNIQFSKPYTDVAFQENVSDEKKIKAVFEFDASSGNVLEIDIAISAVDEEGAKKNRLAELDGKSFDDIKTQAEAVWEKQLEKIIIESDHEEYKTIFYTALYRTMIAPNLFTDVDGRYLGLDKEIYTADYDYYTVFSLWDTFRAAHPLYTIIEQERTNDFVKTLLAKHDEFGVLPIWDLWGNETGCMIGYHGVSVIADAYLKGIRDYDVEKAFAAVKNSAMQDHLGLEALKRVGYVPVDEESESVSKTLEYAYDDWTIAQMANALGKTDDYQYFTERAQYYKNIYDPESGFMRGRFSNTWFSPFDPYEVNFNYTEANAWQYSLFVPQDVNGLMELMGGKAALEKHIDNLFNADSETTGRHQSDITGLIGQYAHGNEPSHHMAYLYNFVNRPDKTQEMVYKILTEQYWNAPDGISGNEDCGQMSAWYVLSSLGFYSVTPGSNQYIIGAPLFPKATVNLENGKQFTVVANNLSDKNIYIKSATLNGKPLTTSYLEHEMIMNGGVLIFEMSGKPEKWGSADKDIPVTKITEHLIVPTPFIAKGEVAFKEQTEIVLACAEKDVTIFYRIDEGDFTLYEQPFTLTDDAVIEVYGEKNGKHSSTLTTRLMKIDPNLSIVLATEYANQYNGGGNDALIDGFKGAKDFRTGVWQGYHEVDLDATVNVGSVKKISEVKVNFLQDQRSWIFFPTEVSCYVSKDNISFIKVADVKINAHIPSDVNEIKTVTFSSNSEIQYVRITAKNFGVLPEWHIGYPYQGSAWIFVDEIEVD